MILVYAFARLYKRSTKAGAHLPFAEGADGSIVVRLLCEAEGDTEASNIMVRMQRRRQCYILLLMSGICASK
jgi:hypothetical protein